MIDFWNYFTSHFGEVIDQTQEHLFLTLVSMAIASVAGVTLGILISRYNRFSTPVLGVVGILQTIPSLALLGFLLPLFGIGKIPAIIALFLYALLPIVRNTYTGINEVDKSAKEAALGMGMTRYQLLRYVEIPLAFPIILAGIKTSTVICVGVATLCAYIGAGGLGEFIFRGISLNNTNMILAGAIPASILAILLDITLGAIQKNYKNKLLTGSIILLLMLVISGGYFYQNIEQKNYKLTAGFNSEFIEREDGFKGLDNLYNLPLKIREMEIGLMYKSLHQGEVDVIAGFSTDGRIEAYDLKLLKDDKSYFPPYFAAPLIHGNTLKEHPSLKDVFEQFEDLISNEEMAALNYEIDFKKREIADVAFEFLDKKGIIANKRAGNNSNAEVVIGSKAFTESYLLAHMFAQAIEGQTGIKTQLRLGFGGTKLIFDALRMGDIAIYPEYTGTGLLVILGTDKSKMKNLDSPKEVYHYVKSQFQEKYDISWMPQLGFNNTSALMMRKDMADSLKINRISDLSKFLQE